MSVAELVSRGSADRLSGAGLPDSDDPGILWAWLERTLNAAYGVNGIFYITYPVGDAAGTLAEMLERAVWKCTYPQAYMDALDGNPLRDDRSGLLVLETGKMCRWDDPWIYDGANEAERRRLELDKLHAMDTGVCLPVHTASGRICGGFGLRSHDLPPHVFYARVEHDEKELWDLLKAFDARFRGPFASQTFHISRQERRVLAHMAGGLGVARAAHELGLSPKTVEYYLRGVRERTRSANTAEAVAKAMFFSIL